VAENETASFAGSVRNKQGTRDWRVVDLFNATPLHVFSSFLPTIRYLMTPYRFENRSPDIRFDDYIRRFPSSWVFEHFLKKGSARRGILSSSIVQEQVRRFSQAGTLRRQFSSLEPSQGLLCSLAYLQGARGIEAPETGGDRLQDPLIRSLLVYAGRNKKNGSVRYFGFPEFEPALRPLCAEMIARTAGKKAYGASVAPRQVHGLNDMAAVMTLALQGALEKKKRGGLTREALARIAKLTHEKSEVCVYCGLQAGILGENEKGYFPVRESVDAWLARPADRRAAEMVRSAVEFAGSWNTELLRETLRRAGGAWVSCAIFPEQERGAAISALRILRWAGLVELSKARGETVFGAVREKTSLPPPAVSAKMDDAVVMLPDFTAVIAQEALPEHLYGFGLMGTLQSLDRVYKGVVDRRILNDSLAQGVEGDSIIARLSAWRAPANVVATVREWIREFYRLYITEGPMLVATDKKVSFEIGSFEPLRGCLEPLPVHTLFRIRHGSEAAVREILGKMGFDYRMPCRDEAAVEGKSGTGTANSADRNDGWEPIVRAADEPPKHIFSLRGKKYGTGLKPFDLNETLHVVDYAILTGQDVMIDYGGSPLLRKACYTVTPLSRSSGPEPLLEGTVNGGREKKFYIRKISRIGVGAP
jgi:hypothetical protein